MEVINCISEKAIKIKRIIIERRFKFLIKKALIKVNNEFKFIKFKLKKDYLYKKINFKTNKKRLLLKNNELKIVLLEDKNLINTANNILENKFEFLGMNYIDLGDKIFWNKDYLNEFFWDNKYYKHIKLTDKTYNADVKLPWELSRFQYLPSLGAAYLVSNDNKYAVKFFDIIEDWEKNNPYKMSVNWTCAMEVAIRAVNIITALEFFEENELLKNNIDSINGLLYKHGEFIYNNLEIVDGIKSNHYLSDICGLFWLGIYFKGYNNESGKWLNFSLNELEKEIKNEVNVDGTSYEGSTSYHRLVTELFLFTAIFAKKNGYELSKNFNEKLKLMVEFLYNISNKDNVIPLIGDNDDGRFIVLSNYYSKEKYSIEYIIDLFNGYSNIDYYFNKKSSDMSRYLIFKNGNLIKRHFDDIRAYKLGGYYIMKNDRLKIVLRCGELSFRGQGAHSHNDQLSFELSIDGNDIFIDPGSYLYSSNYELRNKFRSTSMHNTVMIDNVEQNEIEFENLFQLKERTNSKILFFNDFKFIGTHEGYKINHGVIHKREININEKQINIIDEILGENKSNKKVIFNLAPNLDLKINDNEIIINSYIHIITNLKFNINESIMSKSYGLLNKNKQIIFETNLNKLYNK